VSVHVRTGTRGLLLPITAVALWLGAGNALAQSKVGTTIGQFLLIEPSARISAMGNAGVALEEDIQGVYYNPAALGKVREYAVQLTHAEWFVGIDYNYAAASIPIGQLGTAMLSVTSLGSGEIDVRTVEKPHGTGERYSVTDIAIGLGGGRQITDRFSVGFQAFYVQETIWHSSVKTLTMNVGTIYQAAANGLRIGSSISNIGTKAQFSGRDLAIQYDNDPDRYGDNSALPGERFTDEYPMPILFRVGVSLPRRLGPDGRLLVAVDAFHPSDNTEALSFGAEWLWRDTLALRTGYQNVAQKDTETGLTFGAGLKAMAGRQALQFDYSWADYGRLEATHRMTFTVLF
jgi:hypothetical protein